MDELADRADVLKARTVFLAVACACAFRGIDAHARKPFEIPIQLRVDRSIMSRIITEDLRDETESLWRPYGVQIEWVDTGAGEAAARGFSLEAILARRIEEPDMPNGAAVLGRAIIEHHEGLSTRPIRVSFDATETMLAFRTKDRPPIATIVYDRELSRALGRVLAHEVGHVLLAAPYHDDDGLMRAVFRADELAHPSRTPFRLTCNGVGRLRSRIRVMTGIEHQPLDREMCIPSHPVR